MKNIEEETAMSNNFFQKGNPIIEIVATIMVWVKNQIENLREKFREIGLSSVAQWCIILVMLYLTLSR
jgi:hypothetical protein